MVNEEYRIDNLVGILDRDWEIEKYEVKEL
jgi:hypothetical protein